MSLMAMYIKARRPARMTEVIGVLNLILIRAKTDGI